MASRLSEFTLRRRVQFAEVDSAGIVHFSRYFRYMEEAEHAMWREVGLSIAAPGCSVGFPRVAAGFEYQRPLRFEEEFDIHIRIVAMSTRSIGYRCVLHRGADVIASGTMTIVCVDRSVTPLRATPFPDEVAGRFEVAAAIG